MSSSQYRVTATEDNGAIDRWRKMAICACMQPRARTAAPGSVTFSVGTLKMTPYSWLLKALHKCSSITFFFTLHGYGQLIKSANFIFLQVTPYSGSRTAGQQYVSGVRCPVYCVFISRNTHKKDRVSADFDRSFFLCSNCTCLPLRRPSLIDALQGMTSSI
jgi:hypothetical protein